MHKFEASKGFQRHAQGAFQRMIYQPDGRALYHPIALVPDDFGGLGKNHISARRFVKRHQRALSGTIPLGGIGL